MHKTLLHVGGAVLIGVAFFVGIAQAQTSDASPLWLRDAAISPDGSTVAFTYRGDIFTVPTAGGEARQLTTNPAHDYMPVWSPDGKQIAFCSNRRKVYNVWLMDAQGGSPVRLTNHSSGERPLAFLDDTTVVVSAAPGMPSKNAVNGFSPRGLYSVSTVPGRRMKPLLSLEAGAASVNLADGRLLYQDRKTPENAFRKHERSSGTKDIWLVEGVKGPQPTFRQLTSFAGSDMEPVWGSGDTYYYLSEQGPEGTMNVWQADVNKAESPRQLTRMEKHPVRSLSVATDGTLAFSWDGELWTLRPGADTPSKLPVTIKGDFTEDDTHMVTRDSNASNAVLSPSGKEVAFVVRGGLFVTPTEYPTTATIAAVPGQVVRNVVWAPDGKKVYYDSERDGVWSIYTSEPSDTAYRGQWAYAPGFQESLVVKGTTDSPAMLPRISPDGNQLAYLSNRHILRVKNLKTGKDSQVLDGKYAYSYQDGDLDMTWSPDSRWILFDGYIGNGGWNNSDVAAVPAPDTPGQVVNLTESGYSAGSSLWTLPDGKAVTYTSDREGMRSHGSWGSTADIFLMFLDGDAYAKFRRTKEEVDMAKDSQKAASDSKNGSHEGKGNKKGKQKKAVTAAPPFSPDFDQRRDRTVRLSRHTSNLAGGYYLNPEMDKLYYIAAYEGKPDLWMLDLKDGSEKIVAKGFGRGNLQPDSTGKKLFSGASMKIYDTEKNEVKNVTFNARAPYSASAERQYMYDHMAHLVAQKFYDENLHGVDWEAYTQEYRKFLPYISNSQDFSEMLSEVLGELNASHTGSGASSEGDYQEVVASLGLFYEPAYDGDGLKIAEVVDRGPAAKAGSLKTGDIITAIDGQPVLAGRDYFPLLKGRVGQRVRLTIKGKPDVIVKACHPGEDSELLYRRWVEHNRAVVDSVSGGRVGYVHITGMDSPSFRTIYDEVLGRYRDRDAIVVDTRWNGGGWLHNDVAQLFSGKRYVDYAPRGQFIGLDPFSQWTKPSVMLVNEANYSDAYGTPYTYHTLGLGKLVGAPIPGTMTAVWWETQIDPDIYFGIPQVKALDLKGNALENQQLEPDVKVYNSPADVLRGIDQQLIQATRTALEEADAR